MTRNLVILLVLTMPITFVGKLCAQTIAHLYVTNEGSNTISLYNVDASSGELTVSTTVTTPPEPVSLSFKSSGTYAYLTSSGQSPAVTEFSVGVDGTLTQIGSVTLSNVALPVGNIDRSGSCLLITDVRTSSVSSYFLNTDGSAIAADTAPLPTLTTQLVFSPVANIIYAAGANSSLTTMSFSPSNGAVSEVSSIPLSALGEPGPAVEAPVGKMISLDPSGRYLYVTDPISGTITGFSVNPSSGALSQLPGAPYSLGDFMATSPIFATSGTFLYLGNWDIGTIVGLRVNADGSLSALAATPTTTPFLTETSRGGNIVLAADPSGKFLYAISADTNQITGYAIDQTTGTLTQIPGLLLSTGTFPSHAVFAP